MGLVNRNLISIAPVDAPAGCGNAE